jgi:hypothetical protein
MFKLLLSSVVLLTLSLVALADESRRFFDFTPVSTANPIVAQIDAIEIPLSEWRAYRDAEQPHAITDSKSMAQKRRVLDQLIDEYLLVDEAYRSGATQSAGFVRQMEATRTMILTDFMAARVEKDKPPVTPTDPDAAKVLGDQLFEAATIDISNEAFAVVKRTAAAIDAASAAAKRGPVVDAPQHTAEELRKIVQETPEVIVVRYGEKTITTRQILVIYAGLTAPRARIDTEAGFVAVIKPMIVPELMAIEATRRGIAADPLFQAKLIQNQNALLRFHMQGLIERLATEAMHAPNIDEQLEAWYRAHLADYTVAGADGTRRVQPFSEVRSRAESEYSVDLLERLKAAQIATLRKNHRIVVHESVLAGEARR